MTTPNASPKSVDELTQRLCRDLHLKEIPPHVWAVICRSPLVPKPFQAMTDREYETCKYFAIKLIEGGASGGDEFEEEEPRRSVDPERHLDSDDLRRALLQSRRLAVLFREEPEVRELRKRYFSGQPISPKSVTAMLQSVAVCHLPVGAFLLNRIPLHQHKSWICQPDGSRSHSWDMSTVIRIRAGRRSWNFSYYDYVISREGRHEQHVDVSADGVSSLRVLAQPDSALAELARVSKDLAALYPFEDHEAFWFLLTDRAPQLEPVRVRSSARRSSRGTFASIVMTIEPSVSPNAVRAIFKAVQRKTFKRPTKTLSEESYNLISFVDATRRKSNEPITWPLLFERWKGRKAGYRYGSEDAMRRAYQRGVRWLTREFWFPDYAIFNKGRPSRPRGRVKT